MKSINLKPDEMEFVVAVVDALQMDIKEFAVNVENKEVYDTSIFNWTRQFYEDGIHIKQAIIGIHAKRMSLYKRKMINFCTPNNTMLGRSVLNKIRSHPSFTELTDKQKKNVLNVIDKLIETNLYFEEDIVDQILQLIENQYPPLKKKNFHDGSSDDIGLGNSSKQRDLFQGHTRKTPNPLPYKLETESLYFLR